MKLTQRQADIFIPDEAPLDTALARTTHLGIVAHQDDLEFSAIHGILACYDAKDQWFTGVTCTDGSGSPRTGEYSDFSDRKMAALRRHEQREAARTGKYSLQVQLG